MTLASMLPVLVASRSSLPTACAALPIWLFSTKALVRDRMTLVDSDAPPATPTAVLPMAIAAAAATDTTLIDEASPARTVTSPPPVLTTLGMLTILASTSLSILLCASASPMLMPTLVALVLPDTLADAAIAVALIDETSLAVTLTVPPAETAAAAPGRLLRIDASTSLPISLKLSAPVAFAEMAVALPLRAMPSEMPKPSDWMSAWLSAATVTVVPAVMPLSSTSARVSLSISLLVSEKPRPTAAAVFCDTAIDSATAPAVELMVEWSCALTPKLPPAVTVLPLRTRACVLLRILLTDSEPAPLPAIAEPPLEPPMLPAAPIARAKMSPAMSASTVTEPPALTVEFSISASSRLPSLSPPMLLTENAAPMAPAPALPCPLKPTETAMPPAALLMTDSSAAMTPTSPVPSVTVLPLMRATVSKSIRFTEPEAAPEPATPLPDPPCATATAPAIV